MILENLKNFDIFMVPHSENLFVKHGGKDSLAAVCINTNKIVNYPSDMPVRKIGKLKDILVKCM
jgi:hypothetical protein